MTVCVPSLKAVSTDVVSIFRHPGFPLSACVSSPSPLRSHPPGETIRATVADVWKHNRAHSIGRDNIGSIGRYPQEEPLDLCRIGRYPHPPTYATTLPYYPTQLRQPPLEGVRRCVARAGSKQYSNNPESTPSIPTAPRMAPQQHSSGTAGTYGRYSSTCGGSEREGMSGEVGKCVGVSSFANVGSGWAGVGGEV